MHKTILLVSRDRNLQATDRKIWFGEGISEQQSLWCGICCCLNLSWDGRVNEASSIDPFHYCAGKRPSWTGPSFLAAVAGVPPIGENCWLAVGVPCFSIR
jgi:hypothetical protein